jgi:hypothetical protein
MPQGWTASLISFFSWWNKENRVLILPILNKFLVITEAAQQTYAGSNDNKTKYNLFYCSKPQKLYLMKFRMVDSLAVSVKTKIWKEVRETRRVRLLGTREMGRCRCFFYMGFKRI